MTNCKWVQDSDWENSGDYHTECGGELSLTVGTPKDNDMKYCCFCGKELIQILVNEDEEND